MKTSELQGAALDWAVAKCEGVYFENLEEFEMYAGDYSTDWGFGGPIIERERIHILFGGRLWSANGYLGNVFYGQTPLIAAMRCYVASKLGDEVEIPEELK